MCARACASLCVCAWLLMDETCLLVKSCLTAVNSSHRRNGGRSWPRWLTPWKAKVFTCDVKTLCRCSTRPDADFSLQMYAYFCVGIQAGVLQAKLPENFAAAKQKSRHLRGCRDPPSSGSVLSLGLSPKKSLARSPSSLLAALLSVVTVIFVVWISSSLLAVKPKLEKEFST